MRRAAAAGLLAAALVVGSCGRSDAPGASGRADSAGAGGEANRDAGVAAPRAAGSTRPRWGVDTVLCDARVAAADGAKRDLLLTLYPGGSATLITAYAGGGAGEDLGWWSARHDTLALQLATKDGRASGTTTTWRLEGADLRPLAWNREEWGESGVVFRLSRMVRPQ